MVGLKDFRRSLNKDRTSGGKPGNNGLGGSAQGGFTQVTSGPPTTFTNVKSAVSLQPPKMVIKAIQDYKSRAPQELSFTSGDFFHVISEPTGQNADWLEACNPITNARGLVPAACFEVLSRQARPGQGGSPMAAGGSSGGASVMRLYAMVRYDFTAERDDELGAAAGEPIIVIAQSNFEWFVAKPIGRLGGPGLIPVAFVEIKDLASGKAIENVEELISSGVIPTVEEWKKMTADYKKNTIPLGRFDFGGSNGDSAPGEERELILYRLYEDFYDFQIALLDHFSVEAGRQIDENGKQSKRILPLMPGPLEQVDDYITAQRRGDLDQYIAELCALPEYILRSEIVRLFFEPRPGDHCTTHPPRVGAGMTSLPGGGASAPSFIKIKIFSRTSDDLVAIRVPPTVTYDSLMEKVRARLGPEVGVLRYPEASATPGAPMVRMHDDEDLKEWLASGLKLNLYADKN
ncbi:hypothetical protein BCV69DRAFT_265056 [Microstroma glucosiphilum]|uniref:SH3 domain-containing protein n=1 Tax=Pseudomicrostroma glucosiphilum TaxID=1684307 RepID=A0A316UEW2_9BASI|nr:hypothetical protein BCV69DRAFT_265056 [Pseudomicrostroma glucosiphilum]PWN23786.1 hypothetical protein BCV69DRAFT_265056 [Pseudomicrostroma glucosiphilum]